MRLFIAAAVLVALAGGGLLGAAIYLQGSPRLVPPPALRKSLALTPPGPSAFSWRLTGAMSAHRALVLEVETTRPAEAATIAQQLTGIYQDRFDEVLVYFFEPDAHPRLAMLRVQWTRAHGYRTLALREPDADHHQ